MCRKAIGALLVISFFLCEKAAAIQYAYEVFFTDKNSSPFSLSSPLAYLSSRALARRTAQGITVDSSDLPVNPAYIHNVIIRTGGILHESSRWLNMCVVLLSDSTQIHTLDGQPYIKSTKYIAYYSGALHYRPAGSSSGTFTPAAKTSSADGTYYGNTWIQTNLVNGNSIHDKGFDGSGKLIAVLDAGFQYTDTHFGFDSLRNSGRILEEYNFTYANTNVYGFDIHGTQVLSTMAGYVASPSTSYNFVGSAPQAYYALYVTEDDNSEQPIELVNMLCATERADSIGADVVTTSLGYNTFDDPAFNFNFSTDFDGKTTIAAQAANIATKKGMLFVATAGNEGGDSWNMILTPGDADSALTIGSVDELGTPASNSGYGPNAAGQVKPDVCGMGVNATVFSSSAYEQTSGTSFSTPQIAGWAASLWQANPYATPFLLRQAIIKCASTYSAPTNHLGYGIPNFQCTEQELGIENLPVPFTSSHWIIATPNPFSNNLMLAASPDESGYADFTIYDMDGRQITTSRQYLYKGGNTINIALPPLPAGMYILKAVSPTQQHIVKLLKQ